MLFRNLLLLFVFFSCLKLTAQIPNVSFEAWDNGACPYLTDSVPNGWNSPCSELSFSATLAGTSDAHSGNLACVLSPLNDGFVITYGATYITTAIQINETPAYLEGFYKYFTNNGDSAEVRIYYTKYNQQTLQNDTLYSIAKYLYAVNQYSQFSIDLTGYSSSETPDSIEIYFASSYLNFDNSFGINNDTNTDGILYLDDISFAGTVDVDENLDKNFTFYPNPAQDLIHFELQNDKTYSYEILDITGTLISKGNITQSSIHTENLIPGSYLLSLFDEQGNYIYSDILLVQKAN